MGVWSTIQRNRDKDRSLELKNRIRRHDPQANKVGGRVYTPADIRALEMERVPWLGRRRRKK